MAQPLLDDSKQVQGVVFAALDLAWFNQAAADAELPPGSALTVIDQDGIILARHPDSDQWVGRSVPEAPIIQAIMAHRQGTAVARGVDGVDRLYAFTALSRASGAAHAYVSVGVPIESAFAGADRALAGRLAALAAVGALALALAWGGASLLVLRAVRSLVNAARRLQGGELGARTGLTAGSVELRQLGRAFDEMAEALQRREAEREQREKALSKSNGRLQAALGELRRAQQQIVQQERLRALGEMAGGVAHDLNNVLAPIVGYSELLLVRPDTLDDKEKVRDYTELINTAALDAANMVTRLGDFYRPREPDELFRPLEVNDLVAKAISLTQPKWKDGALARGITILIQTDLQEVPPVSGDAAELREALTNLIFNAVDALPAGGTITLRTRADGEHVLLEVGDSGSGMSGRVRRRCLEPFFTTKGEGGTGLGLPSVYGIVQRHEGTMEILSKRGRGTTIRLSLPAKTAAPPREEPAPASASANGPLRVLVVDDEPSVRRLLVDYLAVDGHSVETAGSGGEGLEKFRGGRFDLVITDRAMPEMGGDQVAVAIKDLAPGTPVIMLTGFGKLMKGAPRPRGVDRIVSKPVKLAQLRQAVAEIVPAAPVAV